MDVKVQKPPYKRTDYRYQIWLKERKALRSKAKKGSFKVELGTQPKSRGTVTVDTSKSRSTVDVVRTCLKELGWREYPYGKKDGGICDIYWNAIHFSDTTELPGGSVNKFPGMAEILRKVNLGRSLDIMRSLFPEDYNFHPQQWFLPQQLAEFSDACRRMNDKAEKNKRPRPVFIVKPDEGSQGDGIFLIHEPREYLLLSNKSHVVQEYVANPFLIEDLKFDFRIYVVLASLEPLEVYICKEGLARFCTVAYEPPTTKNITEAFMHLTNYSLNKRSSTYQHTESDDDGSKRTMTSVFQILAGKGYNVDKLWVDIKDLVIKTLIACAAELRVEQRMELPQHKAGPSCFQILGFDVLLDEQCSPVLLEVNANPSLRIDYEREIAPGISEHVYSPVDEDIKKPLICDTLVLMAPKAKLSRSMRRKLETSRSAVSTQYSDKENDEYSNTSLSDDQQEDELMPRRKAKVSAGYGTLEEIYPAGIDDLYEEYRVMEVVADIFLECLGVRMQHRMGPTGFRNFTRRCKISGSGTQFSNAALDIMYIEMQRRWEHMSLETSAGLCYQGFVEALLQLAKRMKVTMSNDRYTSLKSFLDYCEQNMDDERIKRSSGRAGRVGMFPQISRQGERVFKQETLNHIYGGSGRRTAGNSYFIDYNKKGPGSGGLAGSPGDGAGEAQIISKYNSAPVHTTVVKINDKNNKKTQLLSSVKNGPYSSIVGKGGEGSSKTRANKRGDSRAVIMGSE